MTKEDLEKMKKAELVDLCIKLELEKSDSNIKGVWGFLSRFALRRTAWFVFTLFVIMVTVGFFTTFKIVYDEKTGKTRFLKDVIKIKKTRSNLEYLNKEEIKKALKTKCKEKINARKRK